jgi:hypothetical protein
MPAPPAGHSTGAVLHAVPGPTPDRSGGAALCYRPAPDLRGATERRGSVLAPRGTQTGPTPENA